MKKISIRKNHKSLTTDEGVEFIKRFANSVFYNKNISFTDKSIMSANGLDRNIGFDWASIEDQKYWKHNDNMLR